MSLPLFPLNTVLFPGCNLDLQIFEARYLDMIGRCMKQGGGFGVVCILDGDEVGVAPEGFALVGCEARITDFQQQDNGLLGIRVQGGRRFTVLRTEVQRDQLILADVEWLDDEPEQPLQDEDADLVALPQAQACRRLAHLHDHARLSGAVPEMEKRRNVARRCHRPGAVERVQVAGFFKLENWIA